MTIISIRTAIGISVLVEALLPGGTVARGVKEWLGNKLKTLASLLGRLGVEAQKHCLASLARLLVDP